ncbi:hypothetical protein [Brevibacterium siliguriense]|nr:hypothetical protein [Brevibacterium siliguriense]
MDDDQARRRDFIKEVITGLNAVEARRTHYQRFDEAKNRPQR